MVSSPIQTTITTEYWMQMILIRLYLLTGYWILTETVHRTIVMKPVSIRVWRLIRMTMVMVLKTR